MNNKQLAEMIRTLRKKNLEEQNPKVEASVYRKRQKFKPEHIPDSPEASPNDYRHRMAEGMQQSTLGADRSRALNIAKTTLGKLEARASGWQGRGGQSMDNRYESTETDLGPTETGKKSKEEKEDVTVNPPDPTFSSAGSMNKNTTTKELKEKKNATMG